MGLRTQLMRRLGWEKIRHANRVVNAFEAQKRCLKSCKMIFDVGAYDGRTAKQFRRRFPEAKIVCFEPAPEAFEMLSREVADDPNTQPVCLALSDEEGSAPFCLNAFGMTSSLLENADRAGDWVDPEAIAPVQTLEVPVATLDGYCEREGIDQIDLLKIDAQGADLKVLRGGQKLLEAGRIQLIFVEVSLVPLYAGQCSLHEICAAMEGHGYQLFDFFDAHYAETGQLRWADLLFCRS